MTLVAAYERLIGGRGREIMAGEAVPPTPDKPPVILNPDPVAAVPPELRVPEPPPPTAREKHAAENAKVQKRRHHRRAKRKHRED
jgi:hypothetical protein